MGYVLLIYLNDVLSELEAFAAFLIVLMVAVSAYLCINTAIDGDDLELRIFKYPAWVFAVAATITLLIPSEDTRKLMLAVYIGNEIVSSEEFQETTGKAYELLQDWMDEALEGEEQ